MWASVGSVILLRDNESPALVEHDVEWTRGHQEGSRAVLARRSSPCWTTCTPSPRPPPTAIDREMVEIPMRRGGAVVLHPSPERIEARDVVPYVTSVDAWSGTCV